MTAMFDVALGLVFVYLVLSLLASAIAEALEQYLRYRADFLRQGIEKLLVGSADFQKKLYEHPLIKSLHTPSRLEMVGRSGGPSYIPSRQFALALLDLAGAGTSATATARDHVDAIAKKVSNGEIPKTLGAALQALISDAGDDIEKVKSNVGEWFDGSMERVAGWYKRRAQFVLLIIGGAIALGVNVDTLTIVDTLSNDSAVRAAVVAAAEAFARDPANVPRPTSNPAPQAPPPPDSTADTALTQVAPGATDAPSAEATFTKVKNDVDGAVKQLSGLGLPIGWHRYDPETDDPAVTKGQISATQSRKGVIARRAWPKADRTSPWWDEGSDGGSWSHWSSFAADQFATHFLGWMLTAFAISFGAPFWFDTLNRIMVVRSTVKPHEKSGVDGSDDRRAAVDRPAAIKIEVAAVKS